MLQNSPIQEIFIPALEDAAVRLYVKRDDLIDEYVSGNKLFKLKYNVEWALSQGHRSVLTFGGAFSNHIAATASYCARHGVPCIGVIRGERVEPLNAILAHSEALGMRLVFVSRETYREKTEAAYLEALRETFDNPFIIPEGGANALGVKGAREILDKRCEDFDHICIAMGTGASFAGLALEAREGQKITGFPVLKHPDLLTDILKFAPELASVPEERYRLIHDYHFGGYAKWNERLTDFMHTFSGQCGIPLEPVYTGKMMFAVVDLIHKGFFERGTRILAIHTGGFDRI